LSQMRIFQRECNNDIFNLLSSSIFMMYVGAASPLQCQRSFLFQQSTVLIYSFSSQGFYALRWMDQASPSKVKRPVRSRMQGQVGPTESTVCLLLVCCHLLICGERLHWVASRLSDCIKSIRQKCQHKFELLHINDAIEDLSKKPRPKYLRIKKYRGHSKPNIFAIHISKCSQIFITPNPPPGGFFIAQIS
jgi:hypothetical protein